MRNLIFYFTDQNPKLADVFERVGGIVSYNFNEPFDIAVFCPGPDVSPFLYGQKKLSLTSTSPARDLSENYIYRNLSSKKPKLGIGRGAQFLNVMAGGSMYQHISGHASNHAIMDLMSGTEIYVSSQHHQEMVLPEYADVIAMTNTAETKQTPMGVHRFDLHANDKKKEWHDNEVAYIGWTTSLLFQPRPEHHKPTALYLYDLIDLWLMEHTDFKKNEVRTG